MLASRVIIGVALAVSVVAGTAAPAFADDCAGTSLQLVTSDDAVYRVDVRARDREGWEARFLPVHEGEGAWTALTQVPAHAHLIVAVPGKSLRFAVIRAAGERDRAARVLVYEADRAGKPRRWAGPGVRLVRSFDLAELLTEAELAKLSPSISHLQWLFPRTDGKPSVRLTGDDRVELRVVGGRTLELALDHLELPEEGKPGRRE